MKIRHTPAERPRIAVSACLLGQPVRYDGRHKRCPFISEHLAPRVEFIPFCPEVAIGLGVPRPPIELAGSPEYPSALGVEDPTLDVTLPLRDFGARLARTLGPVDGLIFKQGSPSCGIRDIPVRGSDQVTGGIFCMALLRALPATPTVQEQELGHPRQARQFLRAVFRHHRARTD